MTEPIDCTEHGRAFEGFCKGCQTLVCPSCAMFGLHSGHSILGLDEAASGLADQVSSAFDSGILDPRLPKARLLAVRHCRLGVDDQLRELKSKVKAEVAKLMEALAEAEKKTIEALEQDTTASQKDINEWEAAAALRAERSAKVLELAAAFTSGKIERREFLEQASFVAESLETLRKPFENRKTESFCEAEVGVRAERTEGTVDIGAEELALLLAQCVRLPSKKVWFCRT